MNQLLKRAAQSLIRRDRASIDDFRMSRSDLEARLREIEAEFDTPAPLSDRIVAPLEASVDAILGCKESALVGLDALRKERIANGDTFRALQIAHRTTRKPLRPDLFRTSAIITSFWALEGLTAGSLLVSEGKMDILPGFAFGLSFAGVNILVGVLTGLMALRHCSYRTPFDLLGGKEDKPGLDRSAAIRAAACVGTVIGVSAEAVIAFSAARLRALGTHEGVFDFSEVGVWATYDDSLAIMLSIIGVCSAALAIREGYQGFVDPIPGYSEAHEQATTEIDAAAGDLIDDAILSIEEIAESAIGEAEAQLDALIDAPKEAEAALLDLAHDRDAHNDAVIAGRCAAREAARLHGERTGFVRGRTQPDAPDFEPQAWDGLILPKIDDRIAERRASARPDAEPVRAAIGRVEAARAEACAALGTALTGFAADAPVLDALFDDPRSDEEGGSDNDDA